MSVKSFIACSALVLAFGVGSAVAGGTVEKTTIAPQNLNLLSDGLLAKAAPMLAAELQEVRGTWGFPAAASSTGVSNGERGHEIARNSRGGGRPNAP